MDWPTVDLPDELTPMTMMMRDGMSDIARPWP
jgi:hypothetical protein